MFKIQIPKPEFEPLRVLLLGAHSDDIEIGCGGTILRLIREYPDIDVTWVVFSAVGVRGEEARKSAHEFLKDVAHKQMLTYEYKDGYFPHHCAKIKDIFEVLKRGLAPSLIFTHYRNDLHQDHRTLCELTWNTWRDHLILEYEIPKYDGDLGNPNFFVSVDDDQRNRKIELLMRFFQTQTNKHWFSPETFSALMRLRGIECKSSTGYAESFFGRKICL